MHRFAGLFVSSLVLFASVIAGSVHAAAPAKVIPAQGKALPDQYIVVLKDGANPRSVAAIAGAQPTYVYDAALNGFAATLNQGQLTALQHNPNVAYIEQDAEVSLNEPDHEVSIQTTQPVGSGLWGLDRIGQRALPLSGTYTYNTTASNVTAYVLATGIYTAHAEFGGRATNVYDAFGGTGNDCNGHGTHVAGTIGGSTYGVAKGVRLRGVRILDCYGNGSISSVVGGLNYVASTTVRPAVAHLSVVTLANSNEYNSVDKAALNLINRGITLVVTGLGNSSSTNACHYSPSRVSSALTVAGSTAGDRAGIAPVGSCIDLYAPGASVQSAYIGSPTRSVIVSGTPMAAAHVSGVVALYLSTGVGSAHDWIIANATTGVLTSVPLGTPNRLLYKSTL